MTSELPLLLLREKTTLAQGLHRDWLLSYFSQDKKSSQVVIFKTTPIKVPEREPYGLSIWQEKLYKGRFLP